MIESVSLDQLRVLVAISDQGSFSAAARRLGRAQSAVSHAVAALELALDLKLFDRSGRRPQLTQAGSIVLADARAVVARADELKARARAMSDTIEPELGIAVDAMFPVPALTETLGALQSAFPMLPVALFTEALGGVEARILDGSCSLGIAPYWNEIPERIERQFLCELKLVSVVAASHPLAAWQGPIPKSELERHVQLVLTERDNRSAGVMRGVVSSHVWRFADLTTRHAFVLAGFGFCNMPESLVCDDLAAGRLVRIAVEGWGRPDHLVPLAVSYRKGETPGPATSWFIDHLRGASATPADTEQPR